MKSPHHKIRTAVVGIGYLGRFHAYKYAHSPQAELVALVDKDVKKAYDVAEELFSEGLCAEKIPVASDIMDVVDRVEAVSIVVPTQVHYEVTLQCLQHGLHCLVEKPFTHTVAQADHLIGIAREKQVKIQVGHLERFNPAFIRLKKELYHYPDSLFIEARRISGFQPRAADVNVIFDLMIHDIDLLLHLVQAEITGIEANGISVITDKIDIANARIHFACGSFASLTSSRVSKKSERRTQVYTDRKYYTLDFKKQYLESSRVATESTIESQSCNIIQEDALKAEIEHFLTAVRTDKEPLVTAEQGKKALDIAHQITASIAS